MLCSAPAVAIRTWDLRPTSVNDTVLRSYARLYVSNEGAPRSSLDFSIGDVSWIDRMNPSVVDRQANSIAAGRLYPRETTHHAHTLRT